MSLKDRLANDSDFRETVLVLLCVLGAALLVPSVLCVVIASFVRQTHLVSVVFQVK